MEKANQKCPETFESLIVTVKTKMYKTAISVLKNDEDACDAIQEALLSAYKSFDTLQNKEYFLILFFGFASIFFLTLNPSAKQKNNLILLKY